MWNFKGTLWNSTQNILPIYWKVWFLYNIEILRALRFKSSYAFLIRVFETPPRSPMVAGIDSFTIFLHSAKGRHLGCAKDCQWPLKTGRNPYQSHEPRIYCDQSIPNAANPVCGVATICHQVCYMRWGQQQSGRSPNVVALVSATNFSSYMYYRIA